MTEGYRAPVESPKDTDEETDKKDQKKRVAKARLGKLSSHEHVRSDRPHTLGGDVLLRPLAVELPRRGESEHQPKDVEENKEQELIAHVNTLQVPDVTVGTVTRSDELKKLHDEVVLPEEKENDDDESDRLKKIEAKSPYTVYESVVADGEATERMGTVSRETAPSPDIEEVAIADFPELAPGKNTEDTISTLPEAASLGEALDGESQAEDLQSVGESIPPAIPAQEQGLSGPQVGEADGNGEPSLPPEATERFGWGNNNNNPWEQPAGGLANPKVLEKLDKIDARERLNDSYHSSREAGLASAVGLVGLGVILEYFAAKRRDKRLKRKIDAQERQLKKTNQAVRLEQRTTRLSKRKLERIEAANAAKSEHARMVMSAKQAAEVAVGAVAAATAVEHGEIPLSPAQEQVLAEHLMESKVLGRAIKQNPELTGMKNIPELQRVLASMQETVTRQERQVDGLQREIRYEKLQGKQASNRRDFGTSSGTDVYGMPVLPSPSQQLPAGAQADLELDERSLLAKKGASSSRVVIPVAAATVLLILIAVIVLVVLKR